MGSFSLLWSGLIAALTFVKFTDFLPKLTTAVDVTQKYWGRA
jgi:hypothetical protein